MLTRSATQFLKMADGFGRARRANAGTNAKFGDGLYGIHMLKRNESLTNILDSSSSHEDPNNLLIIPCVPSTDNVLKAPLASASVIVDEYDDDILDMESNIIYD